ncbi:MAG TPA: MBL fold metallo-hydrolase [Dehalococcoidia bacterium]|nr:MBL fold metallo-hydrolase [Dehalococcoidia bacterium]
MQIKLTFLGASQGVTGSRFRIEANGVRFLVDCGLYQERQFQSRNWDPFPVPPQSLDAVLLTHAHLDHCGLLPKLVREGFNGPIYCTSATADLAEIILLDSAKLQEQDAEYKKRRHEREGRKGPYPEIPLYTTEDAEAVKPLFSPVSYDNPVEIGPGIEASFHDAGHVLGSAMIQVKVRQDGEERKILFSGDIGRWGKPILRDPSTFEEADYVLVESTYGDRLFNKSINMADELTDVVVSTVAAGGNIVIPSFALERAQEILYYLNEALQDKRIPQLLVFVDSPMAVNITDVFEEHPYLFDKEMVQLLHEKRSPFDFPGLTLVRTIDQSKAINYIKGSIIVIAGSGMCTGGRIKYHLVTNITRPESTILFVGYQAEGTLGRRIVEGEKEVRILGQQYPVKAKVVQLHGFSGHADRDMLLRWLSALKSPPRRVFVVHGEEKSARSFADFVAEQTGWQTSVPAYGDEVILD